MSVDAAWKKFNQKIGNFFKDFKDERELEKEPGVCRDIGRLLCLLCLLLVIGYAFYRLFMDAPNVGVKRVYLDKNPTYAINRLYNSSASYGTDIDSANISSGVSEEQEVLDCPCTTTTISWINYVHFYFINYTSTDGSLAINQETTGLQSLNLWPNMTMNISHFVRDTVDLTTTDQFCGNLYVWPTIFMSITGKEWDCPNMVSSLLSTKTQSTINSSFGGTVGSTNWNDPRASYFESSSLLNQKDLYSNTIRRLRAYEREQYTLQNIVRPFIGDNVTIREMFLKGMTELWIYTLDKFSANSSSTDLDFFSFAANKTLYTFYEITNFYPEPFVVVLFDGQTFLGMNINWTEYYNECGPAYCDVTKNNTVFQRTYTTLAQVGGLWNIAIVVNAVMVWPAMAFLIIRLSRCYDWRGLLFPKELNKLEAPKSTIDTHDLTRGISRGHANSKTVKELEQSVSRTIFGRTDAGSQSLLEEIAIIDFREEGKKFSHY